MKKFKWKPKYHTKFFYLCVFLTTFIISITATLCVIIKVVNDNSIIQNLASQNASNADEKVQKIFKSRTLSLFFAKKESNVRYDGIYGTSWVIPKAVLKKDVDTFECFLATNAHVIKNFISFDTITNKITLNNNFDSIFLTYYASDNQDKLIGSSISERQFISKENVSIPFIAAESKETTKYPITSAPVHNNKLKSLPFWTDNSNTTFIKNSYVDFAMIKLTINKSDNITFYNWINNVYEIDNHINTSINSIEFATKSDFEQTTNFSDIYIGGFPIINNKVAWKCIDYSNSIDFGSNYINDHYSFLSPLNGLEIDGNQYKNISSQILLKNINMGSGSSGSLVLTKINGTFKIIGIWWGIYISSANNVITGSLDMLFSNDIQKDAYPKDWDPYNIINIIERIIANGQNLF